MSSGFAISMSAEGLDATIEYLMAYRIKLEEKARELRNRVAEELKTMTQSGFSGAIVDDLGTNGVVFASVDVKVEDNGDVTLVIASGEDALFAEFGTGIFYNGSAGSSLHPKGAELGYTIGSYGPNGEKEHWWFYENGESRMTHGAPTSMPMYNAAKSIAPFIGQIAMEVFAT